MRQLSFSIRLFRLFTLFALLARASAVIAQPNAGKPKTTVSKTVAPQSVEPIDMSLSQVTPHKKPSVPVAPIDIGALPPTNTSRAAASTSSTRSSSLSLSPSILQRLKAHAVWIDPSLRETVDAQAVFRATRRVRFPVRVLVARRLPSQVKNVDELAQLVFQQLDSRDVLVIVATNDDAHLGVFADDLDDATRRQIVQDGAQTWTQQSVDVGVAQTLRLVSYERRLQLRAKFWRVVLPGSIGVACLLSAFVIWLRRKLKHRARRKISKSIPTVFPPLETEIETERAVETA